MLLQVLFLAMLFGCCGSAIWLGRNTERWTALALLGCTIASPIVETSQFVAPESGILIIDLLLLGFLFVLAMRSDRFWPLWATAFQVVGTLIHVARLVDPTVWHLAYAVAQGFWAYPVLAALALGTWWEARFRTS